MSRNKQWSRVCAAAALMLTALTTTRLIAEECDSADSIFGKPPAGVDSIVVMVEGGSPPFKYFASIDSTGRALFLPEARRPEQTRAAMLGSDIFDQLVKQERSAADADHAAASGELDTSTLDGFLEAVSKGAAVGCAAKTGGIDRYVTVYVAGEESRHECVAGELSAFNQRVVDVVSNAVNETGELLCARKP